MAWVPELPSISDDDWEKLSDAEQTRYNRLVGLKDEYNEARTNYETSMSLVGPAVLAVIGIPCLLFFYFGVILIIAAIIWAFFRVASRSQAYLRYKDAESALRTALADWPKVPESLSKPPSDPTDIQPVVPSTNQIMTEPKEESITNSPEVANGNARKNAITRRIIIGIAIVAIILCVGGIYAGNTWGAYCAANYPGTQYNILNNKCEAPTVTISQEDVKNAIKLTDGSWTVRTNLLDSTKTYTVTGTFTNTGSKSYTFFGGLTLYNSDYEKLGDYKGETMTLSPGQSQTISVVFVTDYSTESPAGVTYKVS